MYNNNYCLLIYEQKAIVFSIQDIVEYIFSFNTEVKKVIIELQHKNFITAHNKEELVKILEIHTEKENNEQIKSIYCNNASYLKSVIICIENSFEFTYGNFIVINHQNKINIKQNYPSFKDFDKIF